MLPELSKRRGNFLLFKRKAVSLGLVCLVSVLTAPAQVPEQSILPCEEARSMVKEGDYQKAARLIKVCLVSKLSKNLDQRAEAQLLGAEIEYYLGNNTQASEYAIAAEKYYDSLTGEEQKARWLLGVKLKNIRAGLDVDAGAYESALKLYQNGLTLLETAPGKIDADGGEFRRIKADLLSGTAFIRLKTGLYTQAITDLEAALATLDNSSGDLYSRAFILNDFGHLLNEQRSFRQAVGYLEQAAQIWEQQKDIYNYTIARQNLAVAFRGIGNYREAQKHFQQVRDLALKNNFGKLVVLSLQGLASLSQISGDHQTTIEILQNALRQSESIISPTSSVQRAEILWRLSLSQTQIGTLPEARANAAECYEQATRQKIGNLRYLCATSLGETYLADSPENAGKWLRTAVEITENLSREVAGREPEKIYFMQDKSVAYHHLIELLVQVNRAEEALTVAEKLKSRVLRERLANRSNNILDRDPSKIRLSLPADSLVASYVLTSRTCFIFLLRANQPLKIITLPIGSAKLREQIGRYRQSILTFAPSFKSEARELYNLLLKTAENEISGVKRLIIIPDGALWELPFQALVGSSGNYLIEEREISYSPSLGVLSGIKSPPISSTNRKNLVAFANSIRRDAAPLPEAEREINAINQLYAPGASIFVKHAATESRVKTEAANAKTLHLAVHGEIDQANPFESALLFTPEAGDDGRLTISEILQLNLPESLLVLSACDTSRGQVLSGEGLLSLSWAFLAAGGQKVIAAQWAVEEKATARLMVNFHRTLRGSVKDEAAAALRAAQLAALQQPAPFNHPFYWAGFVTVEGPQR